MAKYPIGIDIQTTRSGTGAQAVENDLRDIRQSAEEVRAALDRASDEMIGGPQDRARLTEMADKLDKVAVKGEQLAVVQNKGARSTRNTNLAFLEFSRAVEDAQYGIRGVLNNIPQMVLLMGGSGGLAGIISIAAVSMSQLFTQLTKVEEKLPEATERLEELKQGLVDIHEEIGRENFEGYLKRFNAMDAILARENTALAANVKLLSEKRKGQLAIAAIQDDIDLKLVAQRELSDPNYTPSQATSDRDAISRRKIQRELGEVEASAQDQITQVTEARLQTLKDIAKTEQDILAHDQQTEKIKAELADLRTQEVEAARLRKQAEDYREKNKGFIAASREFMSGGGVGLLGLAGDNDSMERNRVAARSSDQAASLTLNAEDAARLNQITIKELPSVEAATESAKSKLTELEQELKDRDQDIRLVGNETDVLIENARGMADQQTKLAEIETTNRELSQGAQEFSASLGQLEGLSKTVSEARQGDKATVETLAALMQEVTADGIVTQQELTRINTIVTQSALQQGQATTETAAAVRNLQEVTRTLMNEVRQMKAGQIQISRTGTR